jgi:hypothetical protein
MIWIGSMNATKPLFLLKPILWFWEVSNACKCSILMLFSQYNRLLSSQAKYIKQLERYNDHSQKHLGRAYMRASIAHYRKGEIIQCIERALNAVTIYKYDQQKAYSLCAKAYRILSLNCPYFNQKILWEIELLQEKKLLEE